MNTRLVQLTPHADFKKYEQEAFNRVDHTVNTVFADMFHDMFVH